jgi:hypothetical protein
VTLGGERKAREIAGHRSNALFVAVWALNQFLPPNVLVNGGPARCSLMARRWRPVRST